MKDENRLELLMDLMPMNNFTGSDCDPRLSLPNAQSTDALRVVGSMVVPLCCHTIEDAREICRVFALPRRKGIICDQANGINLILGF